MQRRGRAIATTVAALAMTLAVAPELKAQDQERLHLTIIEATPAFHSLPVFALKETSADYNLEIENLQVQGGGEAGVIFAGGNGDIMMAGFDKPVGFEATGLADVKVFGAILKSMNWSLVAPADSEIETVADLKGKTVGISGPGSSSDMLMRWAIRKAGMDPDRDVTLIALGSVANLYSGIENGKVDAAVLVRPYLSQALDAGIVKVVGDWEAMPYPNLVSIAREEDLAEDPEKFVRFQSAMRSVLEKMKNDRAFALEMAKRAYPDATEEDLSQQLDFAMEVYWKPMDGEMSRELYDQAVDLLVTSGRVNEAEMPSYEALVVTLAGK